MGPMLLGLDTTTERIHAALVQGERHWGRAVTLERGQSQSRVLLPLLDDLLAEAGAGPEAVTGPGPKALTGVVCCVGPGGFTSLRIGVATAEGLALTGLPTWGFSAFELRARALEAGGFAGPRWILLDGQRQEAFAQRWSEGPDGPAVKHPLGALPGLLAGEPWWAPPGFRDRAETLLGQMPLTLPDEAGATLAALAHLCRDRSRQAPEAPLVPFYLRETDAEVNFPEASAHLPEALRRGHAR